MRDALPVTPSRLRVFPVISLYMCGIAGLVTFDDRYRIAHEQLARMSDRIAHRGPDQDAMWINHESEINPEHPQAGFAFRRLAILDPDPRASQPFATADGRYTLVFNGEIYNYQTLRLELTRLMPDYAWRTTGDTEVLLMAFAAWGHNCLPRLNGMFAFAVWDSAERSLFIARDRMGQKPLFYATPSGGAPDAPPAIAFASELGALLPLPWIDTGMSASSLADYLLIGYIPAPRTIYTGVSKLQPGHWLRTQGDGMVIREYFDAGGHHTPIIDPEYRGLPPAQQSRRLVEQAVARQLVSDVPLGCFLSGGIDSSIVAACMKRASADVRTFAMGFDDPRYDESPWAARVAQHLGTRHETFHVTPAVADDLPKLAAVFGEPFADSSALPTHYLSRETRKHVKVALSGDGGDELFGGYERYAALRLSERLNAMPLLGRLARAGLWQRLPGVHPKSRLARLKRFQRSLRLDLASRYPSYVRLFTPDELPVLFHEQFVLRTDPQLIGDRWFSAFLDQRDPITAAMAIDRVTYLPDDLLTKIDRASMLHNLEVRSPFMDHELVQYAASLSADQLIGHGPKALLREGFADDLPREVFARRKMGFALPIGEWFRTDLRDMLHDHLFASDSFATRHFRQPFLRNLIQEHESMRADHSQRLYALLMLETWWSSQ